MSAHRIVEPVGLPLAMHVQAILAARAAMPNQRLVVRHVEDPVACLSEPFEMMLHEGPAPTKGIWYSRVLARVPLRLVASREYLARRGAPETVDDLSGHDTLGWSRPGRSPGAWPLRDGGTVNVVPWFSSSDPHLLCTIAAQGGGLFLAPRMPFFDDPDAAGLEQVLGDQVADEIVFRVTTPFPSRADSRTRETLRTLHQQLDALPMD